VGASHVISMCHYEESASCGRQINLFSKKNEYPDYEIKTVKEYMGVVFFQKNKEVRVMDSKLSR